MHHGPFACAARSRRALVLLALLGACGLQAVLADGAHRSDCAAIVATRCDPQSAMAPVTDRIDGQATPVASHGDDALRDDGAADRSVVEGLGQVLAALDAMLLVHVVRLEASPGRVAAD